MKKIRVATRPVLSLELVLGGKKVRVKKSSITPTLTMIEGQTKEVVASSSNYFKSKVLLSQVICRADQAYPKPTFLWTLGQASLLSGHPHPPSLSTSLQVSCQPAEPAPAHLQEQVHLLTCSPAHLLTCSHAHLTTSLQSSLEPSTPSPPPTLSLPHPPAVER